MFEARSKSSLLTGLRPAKGRCMFQWMNRRAAKTLEERLSEMAG